LRYVAAAAAARPHIRCSNTAALLCAHSTTRDLLQKVHATVLDEERQSTPEGEVGNDVDRQGLGLVDLPLDETANDQVHRDDARDTD